MENLLKNKWVLWGGVGAVALAVGYWAFTSQSVPANTASSAPVDPSLYNPSPAVYSSGTGTVPIDSGSISSGGSSSLDYLNALLQLQEAQAANNAVYQNNSLDVQKQLGLASIAANENLGLANTAATVVGSLTDFAKTADTTLLKGSYSALGGSISAGGQVLNYSVADLNQNPRYNVPLISANPSGSPTPGPYGTVNTGTVNIPNFAPFRAPDIRAGLHGAV